MEKINLLVILGTGHKGGSSEKIAEYVFQATKKFEDFNSSYLDIKTSFLTISDDGTYKSDPDISKQLSDSDAFIFVVPEYNYGYPGSLKIFLDSYYDEYTRKASGMIGVSNGVFSGARALISLTPVLRRLGMLMVHKDLFIGNSQDFFDAHGKVKDVDFNKRLETFIKDLVWLAKTLKEGRRSNV